MLGLYPGVKPFRTSFKLMFLWQIYYYHCSNRSALLIRLRPFLRMLNRTEISLKTVKRFIKIFFSLGIFNA